MKHSFEVIEGDAPSEVGDAPTDVEFTIQGAYAAEHYAEHMMHEAEKIRRIERDTEEQAARDAADVAIALAQDINEARADAMNNVLRAICRRKGQPVIAFGPADAQAAWNHAIDLIHLQGMEPVEVDAAYLQGSTPNALMRGAAIERAQKDAGQ